MACGWGWVSSWPCEGLSGTSTKKRTTTQPYERVLHRIPGILLVSKVCQGYGVGHVLKAQHERLKCVRIAVQIRLYMPGIVRLFMF